MRRLIFLAAFVPLVQTAGTPAQTPAVSPSVFFEAASVKINSSGESNTSVRRLPGGRFTATNVPVALLLQMAFQLQQFQFQGSPGWLRTDRFDINAKYEGDPPQPPVGSAQPDLVMLALRTLLADRFKLSAHWETQDLPIDALVPARADGKLGPNIRPAAVDCTAAAAANAAAAKEGRTTVNPNTPDRMSCGMRNSNGRIMFGGYPMSFFATALSNEVNRVVVDRTGLAGNWDLEPTYTRDRVRRPDAADAPAPSDPDGASIFTALQEQLGLKLDSTKGPVQVLVIDRIEPPSPD